MLGGVATKYLQHGDSRTGYEKLSVHEGLEFVEWVLWRKHRSHGMDVLLDARWAEAVWRGRRWGTTHHRVAVNDEGLEVGVVPRQPSAERWNRELLECIRAMPWNFTAAPFGEVPPVVLPLFSVVEPAERQPVQPEFALRKVHISSHGSREVYTSYCRRCMQLLIIDRNERAMGDVGVQRLPNAEERITEFIAEQIADTDSSNLLWSGQPAPS